MRLFFVVGDQLSPDLASLRDADPATDVIAMAEVADEAAFVWNHKQRIALFFSAMRHWAEERRADGFEVCYQRLDDEDAADSLSGFLQRQIDRRSQDAHDGVLLPRAAPRLQDPPR